MKVLLLSSSETTSNTNYLVYNKYFSKLFPNTNVLNCIFTKQGKKIKNIEIEEGISKFNNLISESDYIFVNNSEIFKKLTKCSKVETFIGYICDSHLTNAKIIYVYPPSVYFYNKEGIIKKYNMIFNNVYKYLNGKYIAPGSNIIKSEYYPKTFDSIKNALNLLLKEENLYIDIETRSLMTTEAGIYTIGFSWNNGEGIVFSVDTETFRDDLLNELKEFFINYKGKKIFHNASYDVTILIYELFMKKDITDINALLLGLNVMCSNLDDTMLIAYLATNSCSGNKLSLKELAQPFAGNWAVDCSDVTKVLLDDLKRYNLIDCLSTAYVYETYYPIMVHEDQKDIYENHFLPYLRDNIRIQLTGLPIKMTEVAKLRINLQSQVEVIVERLKSSVYVKQAEMLIAEQTTEKRNKLLKKKVTTIEENYSDFNFNSGSQLACLMYDVMGLPVIEYTKTNQLSTSKKTIGKLINLTNETDKLDVLNDIIGLADASKIFTTFLPAFEKAHVDKNGNAHLLGSFHLGGTVSGRLSSSKPNLQNIPSSGVFGKLVKQCFKPYNGYLFVGLDFASLEDRISALTTKDPNKLKVYLDGYDGHCLRAYNYFKDQMPDIILTGDKDHDVEVINSIEHKYPKLRQRSKAPTFLLTYQGTHHGLMKNCGFSEKEAKEIEKAYHSMYKVSDDWVQSHIKKATKVGYITTGFGLKLRTKALHGITECNDLKGVPASEARTAGNALGQGWGMLNDRALNEIMREVDRLGLHEHIMPACKIHDASYYVIKNDLNILTKFNEICIKAVNWNNHPDIYHDKVGLGGDLEVYFPSWAEPYTLKGIMTAEDIKKGLDEYVRNIYEKRK